MDLTPHVESLRQNLASAAEVGGEESRRVVERLGAALDSAARLVLLDALSAASAEITRELAPGSVDVCLRGRDADFVVTLPPHDVTSDASTEQPGPSDFEDGSTARVTVRLPESLKPRIEDAASREGLSVNAWLVRAAAAALAGPPRPPGPPPPRRVGRHVTGWVR